MVYGFVAAILCMVLFGSRDYLSTFAKIGVIAGMAVVILIVAHDLKIPDPVTAFTNGTGLVFAGKLSVSFCNDLAVHSSSRLNLKWFQRQMVEKKSPNTIYGYGSMLMESMVGVMALIAACDAYTETPLCFINTQLFTDLLLKVQQLI